MAENNYQTLCVAVLYQHFYALFPLNIKNLIAAILQFAPNCAVE